MENPYCSCKLTRVRSEQVESRMADDKFLGMLRDCKVELGAPPGTQTQDTTLGVFV